MTTMTPEEYKQAQKKRLEGFKIGAQDQNGNTITKIFGKGDEYVVYEIETKNLVDSVKVYIDNLTEKDESGIINRYNEIRAKFVEVKGLLYKVIDTSTIKTIISQILIHGIVTNPEHAKGEFDKLKITIDKEYKEQFNNRMRFIVSSLVFMTLLIMIAVFTYYNHYFIDQLHIRNLVFVCAGGSIGAFLSIAIGVNKIICEKDVNEWLYIIYGLERIVIGILASVIVYFSIKANLIFGFTNSLDNPLIGYIMFSIVGGFSETLVPNLLVKLEKE